MKSATTRPLAALTLMATLGAVPAWAAQVARAGCPSSIRSGKQRAGDSPAQTAGTRTIPRQIPVGALGVVDLNSFTVDRTTSLAASPLVMTATPPGAGQCSYVATPRYSSWSREGGRATITLTTGCAWHASTSAAWLHLRADAASGFGTRAIEVAVDPYFGTDAARSAAVVIGGQVVTFTQAGFGSQPPFGSFDTPQDFPATFSGSVAVTGWALDDVGVAAVHLYRDPVAGEPQTLIPVGNGTFVDGARPDVQALYPALPFAPCAGWGYMLLTNMLPASADGSYRLHVYVADLDGHTTYLGSRTIRVNNATAAEPFGTIDTPGQGEVVSGVITNWGWALTPQPANIAPDGSTIEVHIDGIVVGRPTYGFDRADIAALFPGYANSNSAVGYFTFGTRTLTNGVHRVAWLVRDSLGRSQGIGSRYFTVQNP